MKPQVMILVVLGVLALLLDWAAPVRAGSLRESVADEDELFSGGPEDDAFLEGLQLKEIAFIENGQLNIRLTPGQYHTAKGRSRIKRRGDVRMALRGRQVLAVNDALGTKRDAPQAILKVNAVDLRRSRLPQERVESHCYSAPADDFKRRFQAGEFDQ